VPAGKFAAAFRTEARGRCSMVSQPKVFVVDDDPATRHSVEAVVQSRGLPAESYSSAEAFLNRYDGRPGCVIADLRMPDMTGLELQRRLAARRHPLPVILLAAHASVPLAVRAMQSGAVTLLEKPCREEDISEAVSKAVEIARVQDERQQRGVELEGRMNGLTAGERRVLDLLVEGNTNKTIAARLDLGLRTVEKYRHNVFKKLGVNSLPDLMRLVIEWETLRDADGHE
jgi:FixJ family two-component response regulator